MSHDLDRHLSGIPREPAPEIPVESLLERSSAAHRRWLALGGVGVAAVLLVAASLSESVPEAPVHLDLRVVNVEPQEDEVAENAPGQPAEFDRP